MVQFVKVAMVAALAATPILAIPLNARYEAKHPSASGAHHHHHQGHRAQIKAREPVDPKHAHVHTHTNQHAHAGHHHHSTIHAREPKHGRASIARAAGRFAGGVVSAYGREFDEVLEARGGTNIKSPIGKPVAKPAPKPSGPKRISTPHRREEFDEELEARGGSNIKSPIGKPAKPAPAPARPVAKPNKREISYLNARQSMKNIPKRPGQKRELYDDLTARGLKNVPGSKPLGHGKRELYDDLLEEREFEEFYDELD
ncbi:hypothetical protein CPB83DRAFT_911547 [Crepidotus variabilis]|uniref:Uncharacterized protein n=1 Tax=Crepidotus variabilis TaxID=179855 RepID=A0A9P6JI62_9AGAR|nr:hypothetical protein CPB83DRAFT_911547 [Crepidotus variabilis]